MLKFINQEGAYNPVTRRTRFFGMDGASRVQFTISREALERLEGKELPDHALTETPAHFRHADLARKVLDILHDTGLAADRAEFEITEGVLIDDPDRTLATLKILKDAGVRI